MNTVEHIAKYQEWVPFICFNNHDYWFQQYDNLFIKARYPYEPDSRSGHTEISIKVGIEMFKATIRWYKDTGNTDLWVKRYPDVTGGGL